MNLLSLIENKYKVVSIVGLAKNTGKTTTLNHLIQEAKSASLPIGITSIGRDGEDIDLVTETEKPKIMVYEGMLIATAEDLLPLGTAKIRVLHRSKYSTVLGDVVIGRVERYGSVQIAGPSGQKGLKDIADIMLLLGASFVLLDGAIDRKSSANPSISEATILSTGAVLSKDMDKVISETMHTTNMLTLPVLHNNHVYDIISELIKSKKVAIIDNSLNIEEINIETALGAGKLIGSHLKANTKYIVIPTSLTSTIIDDLISIGKYRNLEIVIDDGTKLFISSDDYKRYVYLGINIKVMRKIDILAITLNPTSPRGYSFNASEFLLKMRDSIKDIPVIDVLHPPQDD
jgi:hypothetical protein